MYEAPDDFLYLMILEHDDYAYKLLYEKFNCISKMILKKYFWVIKKKKLNFEELLLECNVIFIKALKKYQNDKNASLTTYIYTCIDNYLKTELNKDYLDIDDNLQNGKELIEVIGTNEILYEKIEHNELVSELKAYLSNKEKNILNLLIEGNSYDEISIIMGENKKNIYNCVTRIKNKTKMIENC